MFKKIGEFKRKIEKNKGLNITFKIMDIVLWIFLILFLAVILVQKFTENNYAIGGYRIFSVATGSMAGEYDIGDIIVSKSVPESELKVGDNITYLVEEGDAHGLIITHKIVKIKEVDGKKMYTPKGNANDITDPDITYSQIYGKVIYKTFIMSFINKFLSNSFAYYAVAIIVCIQIVKNVHYEYQEENEDEEES